jgi:hypothetical protein
MHLTFDKLVVPGGGLKMQDVIMGPIAPGRYRCEISGTVEAAAFPKGWQESVQVRALFQNIEKKLEHVKGTRVTVSPSVIARSTFGNPGSKPKSLMKVDFFNSGIVAFDQEAMLVFNANRIAANRNASLFLRNVRIEIYPVEKGMLGMGGKP